MQTLKKLAVIVGFLLCLGVVLDLDLRRQRNLKLEDDEAPSLVSKASAQPIPIKVGSLVPVTVAQPNALILLTIPGVTNYVISVANFQTQIGGGSTNFSITIATGLTNLIYTVGSDTTNYVNSIFTSLSNIINSTGVNVTNLIYVIGANLTNFVIATGTDLTNLIYTVGANCTNFSYIIGQNSTNFTYLIGQNSTNYTDLASSNRVAVDAGANVTVTTNAVGNTMVFTVSSAPVSGSVITTNITVVSNGFFNYAYVTNLTVVSNLVVLNNPPSTNEVVVLSGTNVLVEVTRTNQTNFYTVNSTASGGGGSVTNLTNSTFYGFTNVSQIVWFTNALSELDSNIFICPSNGPIQWLEFTNGWLFMNATNLEFEWSGNHVNMEVWLKPKQFAVDRTIVLNPNWHMFSGARTNLIFSNKLAILRLRKTGTNETDIMASWEPEL